MQQKHSKPTPGSGVQNRPDSQSGAGFDGQAMGNENFPYRGMTKVSNGKLWGLVPPAKIKRPDGSFYYSMAAVWRVVKAVKP